MASKQITLNRLNEDYGSLTVRKILGDILILREWCWVDDGKLKAVVSVHDSFYEVFCLGAQEKDCLVKVSDIKLTIAFLKQIQSFRGLFFANTNKQLSLTVSYLQSLVKS